MALILEAVSITGVVQRVPVAKQVKVTAQQGFSYKLVDDANANFSENIGLKRVRNSLIVDGLPQEQIVELDGFFFNCVPTAPCSFVTSNIGGTAPVTPASEPVAALQDGNFLMFGKGDTPPVVTASAPEAEFSARPLFIGAGVLGLVALAAGGKGGGGDSGGGATLPPAAPTLTSASATKETKPILTGTTGAGATVRVGIDVDGNGTSEYSYLTQADANGNWTIDLATAVPVSAALGIPASGLAEGTVTLIFQATNAAGTSTGSAKVLIDKTPPTQTATIDRLTDDQVGGVVGDVAKGGLSNDKTPTLAGTVSAALATGESVEILRNGVSVGKATINNLTWTFVDTLPAGPVGTVSYTARVVDLAGNVAPTSAAYAVSFDIVAPAAPTIAVVAGDNIVNAAEALAGVLLTGSAEAGSTVSVSWLRATPYTTTANAAGAWQIAVPSADITGTATRPISVIATDVAGNASTPTTQAVSVVTGLPGTPTLNPVATDNRINIAQSQGPITVTGTADAGTTVSLAWVGTSGSLPASTTAAANGAWSITYTAAQIASLGQFNGQLTVTSRDLAGNTRSIVTNVVVDTIAPTPTISAVTGDDIISGAERAANVVINGTVEAGSSVSVTWGGTTVAAAVTGGSYSATFTPAQIPPIGASTVSAVATDASGNVSAAPTTRPVSIQGASQTTAISSITDDFAPGTGTVASGGSTNDGTPTLSGTVSSALAAGQTIHVLRNGVDITPTGVTPSGTTWTFTDNTDGFVSGTSYSYTARVQDTAGTLAPLSTAYAIVFDNLAPTAPTISVIAVNDIVDATEKAAGVTVSGTAEANSSVTVTWGTTSLSSTAGAGGTYSATFSSAQIPADGAYTVTAVATDAAGNVSGSGTHAVQVATAALTFVYPGTALADTVSFTATDAANLNNPGSSLIGGAGIDTLLFSGSGISLDLTTVSNLVESSVERLNLTGSGNNSVTLNTADVLSLGGQNLFTGVAWGGVVASNQVQVVVDGNAGDSISASGGWTADATHGTNLTAVSNGGHSYVVYNGAVATVAVQLLIDTTITRSLV